MVASAAASTPQLTINRKPQGIFSKSPATPLQDKTNTVHNEKPLRVRNQTPWRHMTKHQRKNRKRISRLVEHWPELFNREKTQPLKAEVPDDLIRDIVIRELAFGVGALRTAVASYVQSPRYYHALVAGGARYGQKGQPCGEMTPQEQKEVEARLVVLNDRQKARKPR